MRKLSFAGAAALGVVVSVLLSVYLWPKACVLGGGGLDMGGGRSLAAASYVGYYYGLDWPIGPASFSDGTTTECECCPRERKTD